MRTLTMREVANRWQVTPETVRGLAKEGKLPHLRIGASYRFREEDVVAYEEAQYRPAREEVPA